MRTITLKNVPTGIHTALKMNAKRHKRSLNQEAIFCLDAALAGFPRDSQTLLSGIRALREQSPVKQVDLDWINNARREGRP